MTDGPYLGDDYRFERVTGIKAFIWAEPPKEEDTDEQLELFDL